MKIIFTLHAEEKLKRKDIKNFKIDKVLLDKIIRTPHKSKMTKTGENAVIVSMDKVHDLRIIYDIIQKPLYKVITFHISKKGRYR